MEHCGLNGKLLPSAVRNRLNEYLRILARCKKEGIYGISSNKLARLYTAHDIDSSTVRRDLSYLGNVGRQGYGYDVSNCMELIKTLLGVGGPEKIVIFGVGNMGTALLKYNDLLGKTGTIVVGFDKNITRKIVHGIPIYDINEINYFYPKDAYIVIIATPNEAAQDVANLAIKLGARAIINFTDANIIIKNRKVVLRNVDLAYLIQDAIYNIRY